MPTQEMTLRRSETVNNVFVPRETRVEILERNVPHPWGYKAIRYRVLAVPYADPGRFLTLAERGFVFWSWEHHQGL